jgi:hypothetical protein
MNLRLQSPFVNGRLRIAPNELVAFLRQFYTVRTAAQERWDRLQNGDLLTAAEHAGFEVERTGERSR